MNATRTAGEALVGLLEAWGVDTVFGIPGVHTVELYRGLAACGVRHVLPRHEQGAGFMADGYARVSGRPGVCFVISGPGVTNIATPMGQAYSDSVPMLVVSSVIRRRDLGRGRGRLHEISEQRAVSAPLSAFSATVLDPAEIPGLLARAFASFRARPRPVHIEIPLDLLAAAVDAGDWRPVALAPAPYPAPAAIEAAAARLARARRPLLIVGGGAVATGGALGTLAERLAAAVLTTVAGKGTVPDGHPLSLGALLPQPAVREFVARADLVLALGTELAETDFWADTLPIRAPLIRVDLDPAELVDDLPAALAIQADAGAVVQALLEALGAPPAGVAGAAAAMAREVAGVRAAVADAEPAARGVHRSVLQALRAALPANAVVASDMTQIAYSGNEVFAVSEPRSWLHPVGFGTLGYALPAAIGARLGAPERAVAALAGDYGVQYTIAELSTAAELALPLPVLVWNNAGLGEIRDDMQRRGVAPMAVAPLNPDFQALALACGCAAARPASLAALGDDVAAALRRERPTLIEVSPDIV